jgi:hypothetical protein
VTGEKEKTCNMKGSFHDGLVGNGLIVQWSPDEWNYGVQSDEALWEDKEREFKGRFFCRFVFLR